MFDRFEQIQNLVQATEKVPLLHHLGFFMRHFHEVRAVCQVFAYSERVSDFFLPLLDLQKVLRADPPERLEVTVDKVILVRQLDVVLLCIFPPISKSDRTSRFGIGERRRTSHQTPSEGRVYIYAYTPPRLPQGFYSPSPASSATYPPRS